MCCQRTLIVFSLNVHHVLVDPPNRHAAVMTSRVPFTQQQQYHHPHSQQQRQYPSQSPPQQQQQTLHQPQYPRALKNNDLNKTHFDNGYSNTFVPSYTSPTLYEGSPQLNLNSNMTGASNGGLSQQQLMKTGGAGPYGLFPTAVGSGHGGNEKDEKAGAISAMT